MDAKRGGSLRRTKKLEATEIHATRRGSTRISLRDKIRNEEIKQRMKIEEWIPPGRRRKGRPRKTWGEEIRKAISARNFTEKTTDKNDN